MRSKLLETRNFGLIIGLLVIGIMLAFSYLTLLPEQLELKLLSVHFRLKDITSRETIEEGVAYEERNIGISEDLVILGIDARSLAEFGRWPWPRSRHADLVNSLARITDQSSRESALFLDLFFIEPQDQAYEDAALATAMLGSGSVFIETVLANQAPNDDLVDEYFQRHEVLFANAGKLPDIQGEWWNMRTHFGIEPPLQPYGATAAGYGHANFDPDWDGIFRRQPLVAKVSRLVREIPFSQLTTDTEISPDNYERLAWVDKNGVYHHIEYPLTQESLRALDRELKSRAPLKTPTETDENGQTEPYYIIRHFEDQFLPSITLSLALRYFNKGLDDLEIVLGSHIRIDKPQSYSSENQTWEPYYIPERLPVYNDDGSLAESGEYRLVDEIKIPINEDGEMLINFMGARSSSDRSQYQTFPVRPVFQYANRAPGPDPLTWSRRTLALDNKIVMVGPFATGMADDEKNTPYGLMYGVEMHTNALNTIIMDRFLDYAPDWMDLTILAVLVLLTAFITAQFKNPLWPFFITIVVVLGLFFTVSILFDRNSFIVDFSTPSIAMILTFVAVVVYRALTEGREKRMITETFGKFVSPTVVDDLINSPEGISLGGEERDLTVLFSDICKFTTMSEQMEPGELTRFLNEYLTVMTDLVLESKGTLDKYIGDALMCFWGAPLPPDEPNHPMRSQHPLYGCLCAIRQMEALDAFNSRMARLRDTDPEWDFVPDDPIEIGIGVNSGNMTVGLMGSEGRLSYTLAGDPVNLGSRLEGLTRMFRNKIIISEYTYERVKEHVLARELDRVQVKGKLNAVKIYELLEMKESAAETLEKAWADYGHRR